MCTYEDLDGLEEVLNKLSRQTAEEKRNKFTSKQFVDSFANKHYSLLGDLQAIEIIARSMTQEQFYGYCLGNIIKYKLRAGHKENNPAQQDLDKAKHYVTLYNTHKVLCHE